MNDRFEIDLVVEVDPGVSERDLLLAAETTVERLGVREGHMAIEIVGETRIHELNREHRANDKPTDVLSFPMDGEGVAVTGPPPPRIAGPLELGDVVICPAFTEDMTEAVVHGVLHLCGYDHETDGGDMLALQDEIVDGLREAAR
ncbi:MAG: rRNA maturation RNase YbeY [Solirubrobacterales bacterium]